MRPAERELRRRARSAGRLAVQNVEAARLLLIQVRIRREFNKYAREKLDPQPLLDLVESFEEGARRNAAAAAHAAYEAQAIASLPQE